MKLIIPRIPPGLNEYSRSHWRTQRALQKTWAWEILIAYFNHEQELEQTYTERRKVKVIMYRKRKMDPDNVILKPILDGLKSNHLIVDDSKDWIDLEFDAKIDTKNPRTEITIMEV